MARNASGTYSLPAGNPVVTATVISSTWANTTLDDLKTEMTDSLSRSGKGGMLAALQLVDGTAGAPAATFATETSTGMYRVSANQLGFSIAGTQRLYVDASVVRLNAGGDGELRTAIVSAASTANQGLTFRGNKNAADAGNDFIFNSLATRSAGRVLLVQNNGSQLMDVDSVGTMRVQSNVIVGQTTQGSAQVWCAQVTAIGTANQTLSLIGNRNAADGGVDIILNSAATRTAGSFWQVQNNGVAQLTHDVANNQLIFAVNASNAGLKTTVTNGQIAISGNRNAADTGADVVSNSIALRSAGTIHDFEVQGASKAQVRFNGVMRAPNVSEVSEVTANDAVTGTTMQNVAGLSFPVLANADYFAEFFLTANTSATAIHQVQLTGPAAPTKAVMGAQGIFGTTVSGFGAAGFSTAFQIQPANITTEASVVIRLHLRNGANAGTVQLQHNTNTAGQTATIFAGSNVRYQRVDNAGLLT